MAMTKPSHRIRKTNEFSNNFVMHKLMQITDQSIYRLIKPFSYMACCCAMWKNNHLKLVKRICMKIQAMAI